MKPDTEKIIEELWCAVSSGEITTQEWKTATAGIKIINKVLKLA